MTIVFDSDQELSYNGIDSKLYKANQPYTADTPMERIVFNSMVNSGLAKMYVEPELTPKATKVAKPKAKK
jgi:hypothetical protein